MGLGQGRDRGGANFATGFAELAWRAGEFGVARDVLSKWMPADAWSARRADGREDGLDRGVE